VKTRLCPPCTPLEAARLAAAALADTVDTVSSSIARRRVLVLDGEYRAPDGWDRLSQRGGPLDERLANAFADVAADGPAVLVGMDTPQLTVRHLDDALAALTDPDGPDAVFGPAEDGGWWLLGLRNPRHAEALRGIPTSRATTGADTHAALAGRGLWVSPAPRLRDVDEMADAVAAARACPPERRFAREIQAVVGR
jgi:uncharacterized protein